MKKNYLLGLIIITAFLTACSKEKNISEPKEELTIEQKEIEVPESYLESDETTEMINALSKNVYKNINYANPISPSIFCADPTAVEYEGRLYVYGTNDHQQCEVAGKDVGNTYEHIKSFVIFSTDDMVNWTYHGIIDTKEIAPWIISSWAPSIVSREEEDGLTHFYLYFSNSGCGVGVLTATNPLGPWTDPLGEPLISTSTEGLVDCPNPFDPGVCIDDDGVGWISFGGGRASDGSNYMPGVSRIAQLGEDMISLSSEIAEIKAPYFFEASELNYINGTYIYTYNNSWDKRDEWYNDEVDAPPQCSMSYMTTKTPLDTDSWKYESDYFLNPGEANLGYSNNHTHLHKFAGKYYIFHHTLLLNSQMGIKGGYRSLGVVEVNVDEENVLITGTKPTMRGIIEQVKNVDAYSVIPGEMLCTSAGIDYVYTGKLVDSIKTVEDGAWLLVRGVDFGEGKAAAFSALAKGQGSIEIRLDYQDAEPIAILKFENDDYAGRYAKFAEDVSGVHDVYIVFSSENIEMESWQCLSYK